MVTQLKFFKSNPKDGGDSTEINRWLTENSSYDVQNIIITPLMNSGSIYALSVCIVYK